MNLRPVHTIGLTAILLLVAGTAAVISQPETLTGVSVAFIQKQEQENAVLTPCSRFTEGYMQLPFATGNFAQWPTLYHEKAGAVVEEHLQSFLKPAKCDATTGAEALPAGPKLQELARMLPSWKNATVSQTEVGAVLLEYLRAYDGLNVLSSTSRDTDGALSAIFAALNIDAGLYSLDDGIQNLAFHFARAQNALGACIDVVLSEMGGYFWVNKSGVMRFESRASRVGGYGSPDATWGDGTSIVPLRAAYEYDSSELATSVTVRPTLFLANSDAVEVLRFTRSKDNRPASA